MMNTQKITLAILSGKGGVGKSMLTSSLVLLFARYGLNNQKVSLVAVDADADAPNLNIWLGGKDKWDKTIPVVAIEKPVIDYDKCDGCGLCAKHCKFGAMTMVDGKPVINQFLCEGCGVCENVCPQHAIHLEPVQNGEIKIQHCATDGFDLVTGQLFPGEAGSGKVVDMILQQAKKFEALMTIVDVAPGTSCPVKAVLRETNFVILISEPTLTSLSDLKQALEVINFFKIPYSFVINKSGINPPLEQEMTSWMGSKLLGKIGYDKKIFQMVSHFIPIMDSQLPAKNEIKNIYHELSKRIIPLIN